MIYKLISALPQLIDEVLRCLETGKYDGKTLIWFGYSFHLNALQKALMSKGRHLDFAIDNNEAKWGINPCGLIECRSPHALAEHKDNGVVIIATKYKEEMTRQAKSYGYSDEQIICLSSPKDLTADLWRNRFGELIRLKTIGHEELKKLEFEVLKVFRDFCDEHDLKYFLAEGTLLGAVRHKGFIPWDDDIDVFMPDEDYEKLIELYPSNGSHVLGNWKKYDNYNHLFSMLIKTNTLRVQKVTISYQVAGICIDIFPLGGFSSDSRSRNRRISEVFEQNIRGRSMRFLADYCENRKDIFQEIEKVKYRDAYYQSDYVGMLHFFSKRVSPWAVPRKCFDETIDVEFEGEMFKAPAGYDEYLTARYGDYMTLPPENERFEHHVTAYWLDGKPLELLDGE